MQNVYDLIAMWQYIVEFSCFVINVITLERKLVLAALYVFFSCISFFKGKANVTDLLSPNSSYGQVTIQIKPLQQYFHMLLLFSA